MAGHTIKVSDNVLARLQALQRPRESYSQVIERLLVVQEAWAMAGNVLEGQMKQRIEAIRRG